MERALHVPPGVEAPLCRVEVDLLGGDPGPAVHDHRIAPQRDSLRARFGLEALAGSRHALALE